MKDNNLKNEMLIAIIRNEDIGFENKPFEARDTRYASRAIVKNSKGEIAIFNKRLKNEYKLPGGGIEENEDKIEALKREILEETGCTIEVLQFLGITIEEKSNTNFKQISYIYECKVLENTNTLHLTTKEKEEDSHLLWVTPTKAYNLVKDCFKDLKGSKYDDLYKSLFMVKRDEKILEYYLKK